MSSGYGNPFDYTRMRHVTGEVSVVLIAARNKCPAFPNRSFGDLAAFGACSWLLGYVPYIVTEPLSPLASDNFSLS